jgi:predicted MFS family arabinose efflux permease
LVFGGLQLLTSLTPSLPLALAGLAVLGAASVSFIAIGNSTLQLTAAPGMRGRVMGLYVVAFLGTTPLGGPLMGWIGEHLGPRLALAGGGLAVLIASILALPGLREMGGTSPIGYRPNEPVRSRPDDLA